MKKYICILFVLFYPLVFAGGKTLPYTSDFEKHFNAIEWQGKNNSQSGETDKIKLYPYVYGEIKDYYGRASFSDSDNSSGWYRVENFLKWLEANQAELSLGFSEYIKTDSKAITKRKFKANKNLLATYLGMRYITDMFPAYKKVPFTKLQPVPAEFAFIIASYDIKSDAINFSEAKSIDFVKLLNMAIHEMTHGIFRSKEIFAGEVSTYYTAVKYALPEKDYNNCGGRTYRKYNDPACVDLHIGLDYWGFATGPLILHKLENENFYAINEGDYDSAMKGLQDVLLDLVFVSKGNYYKKIKHISFGESSRETKISKYLSEAQGKYFLAQSDDIEYRWVNPTPTFVSEEGKYKIVFGLGAQEYERSDKQDIIDGLVLDFYKDKKFISFIDSLIEAYSKEASLNTDIDNTSYTAQKEYWQEHKALILKIFHETRERYNPYRPSAPKGYVIN